MDEILKGNFKTKHKVIVSENAKLSLEEQFEREALKRLGGSIAFVSKQKVLWNLDGDKSKNQPS